MNPQSGLRVGEMVVHAVSHGTFVARPGYFGPMATSRKGGPGIERADLLVVNKTDLAPLVGADLTRMVHDAEHARQAVPCWRCPGPTRRRWQPGRLGPAPPGALPVRRPRCPSTPARWRPMLTRTRTEVRSSHLRRSAPDRARVALVPEQAVLLAGDHVTVSVRVGAGAALEIVEPGGTVAYAMRGGGPLGRQRRGGRGREPGLVRRAVRRRPRARTCSADWPSTGGGRVASSSARRSSSGDPGEATGPAGLPRRGTPRGLPGPARGARLRGWGWAAPGARPGAAPRAVRCAEDEQDALESGDVLRRWLGAATHASPLRSSVLGEARSRPPRRAAGPDDLARGVRAAASRRRRRRPGRPGRAAASSSARSRRRPGRSR